MSFILENHFEKVEILDRFSLVSFFDRAEAAAFLRRYRHDGNAMAALRQLLTAGSGNLNAYLSDEALIEKVAAKLVSGELIIRRTPHPKPPGVWSPRQETDRGEPEPGPVVGHKSPAPVPVARDEIARDPVSQALVFVQAALTGMPFCEV